MSSPTPSQGSPISQHLRMAGEILQGVIFNKRYIWSGGVRCVGGLRLKFVGRIVTTQDGTEVKQTSGMDV